MSCLYHKIGTVLVKYPDHFISRDHLIYAVSAHCDSLSKMSELMSEVVFQPKISDEEVRIQTELD